MMKCLKFLFLSQVVVQTQNQYGKQGSKKHSALVPTLCACMFRELNGVPNNRNHADWVS